MTFEHQVWAVPPDKNEPIFVAAFEPCRWQWAEKLVAYLEYRGFTKVDLKDKQRKDL